MKVRFENRQAQDPTRVKGVRVPYAQAKRRVSQWRWYLILLVVASPLIYLLWMLLMPHVTVSAPGYISLEKVSVNSTASGIVERIDVAVGDQVATNQIVVTLYNAGLLERQQVLQAEKDALRDAMSVVQGPSERSLQQTIRLSRDQVDYQASLLEKVQFLYDMGAATIAELNQAKAQHARAVNDLIMAQGRLETIREGHLRDQQGPEKSRTARQKRLSAEMEAIDRQLLRLNQRAPSDGRVLDVMVGTGESVAAGTPLMALGQAQKPYAVAYLDPKHTRYARKGQPAMVKLPNGDTLRAVVKEDAGLTRRIPADISSPITARDIMLLVPLDLLDPLPPVEKVDGLPISIRFRRSWLP
jgi:multidrug resistance efflux pump